MATTGSKTVKFEIELQGLKVKFEGDVQIAEKLSTEITGAITSLAAAQQKLLPAPQRATPAAAPPAADPGPRRGASRRRRRPSGGGIDPAILDGTTVPTNGDGDAEGAEAPTRRRSGAVLPRC
jgi:hypothetical protein